ncbi:MAG: DUF1289 domain-containing protein [Pseudomonadales bacterium]
MLRRTPCVGICSTTYGDLVCRGCKRFAHEIVQWNGFDPSQRQTVWQRLLELRAGAVGSVLEVVDEARLYRSARALGMTIGEDLAPANVAYELLQRLQWRDTPLGLDDMGVRLVAGAAGACPEELLVLVDREFYARSLAQYERNYRIPPE